MKKKENIEQPAQNSKTAKIITFVSLVIVCLLIVWCSYMRSAMEDIVRGQEMDPIEQGAWLATHFSDRLGVNGYMPGWTKKYWVEGFREHTRLIYTQPSPDFAANLFQHIREVSFEEIEYGGGELLEYSDPEGRLRVPEWWDWVNKNKIESVRFNWQRWHYIFGYATEDNILYMIIINT